MAVAAARHLVDVGIPANGGTKWAIAPTVKSLYPNFSHGTAGVGYFLATMHQATGERAFLDAALSGAAYLRAVATTDDGGFKVFHHEPGGEQLYYLSWCHGPAGLSRLFYRLGEVTGDAQWPELMKRAAAAIDASGVPEERTPGFWNNISQCCGNCGVGEYFLTLDRLMPNESYGRMVRRVAADTLARATADGNGLKWIQAENRVQPEAVVAQTGFMQGAAGVGTFFLHADAAASGRRAPAIVWPDTPFTT
jgi:lantibiotic modifying enzyme